ncbi:MAG: hypothetical protein ACXWMH_03095 [Syntrophales bacterium]
MSQHLPEIPCSPHDTDARNFVSKFLFGDYDIHKGGKCVRAGLLMDRRTEGWVGIPHGGIGMGAIMELAMMLDNYPQNAASLYPLSADFRMGGSSVKIGDRLIVEVSEGGDGAGGIISRAPDLPPYVSASVRYGDAASHKRDFFASYIPARFSDIENKLMPLPYYKNCFVCGVGRSHPGLKRSFHIVDSNESSKKIVLSTVGFDSQDGEAFYLFQRNNIIHPIASLALLDETLGWAGFMASASGAVTVRISYTLYRDIRVGEKIVAFGRGDKVRGNAESRLLFWASGGAVAVDKDGFFETIITASGQWLGVPELTRQMKTELMPKELTEQAFRFAG